MVLQDKKRFCDDEFTDVGSGASRLAFFEKWPADRGLLLAFADQEPHDNGGVEPGVYLNVRASSTRHTGTH